MTECLNLTSQFNKKIESLGILVKKSVCKTSHFLCILFVLNAIVQGTSLGDDNLHLSVSVRTTSEKERVAMQHQQDCLIELENNVEKKEKINLSKKQLKELPACLKRAEELKELDISRNRLKVFSLELFNANNRLNKLDISRNRGVAFLDDGNALKGLKCLKAEICGWKVIPAAIGRFSQLEELYLGGNLLEGLDPAFFLNLPLVKVLDLSGNRCIAFGSSQLTGLKSLRRLVLRHMGFDKIPDNIRTLVNLTSLDVNNNAIKHLDSEMFLLLGCLEELNIGNNVGLVVNEFTWKSLRALRSLNAEGLEMTNFPSGLKNLTKLQKLFLGDNKIPVLNPVDFAGFPDLEHLEFNNSRDKFDVVTTGWGRLKALKKLIINGGTLEELGDWAGELQSLEELNLSWNSIHDITDEFFAALSKLPNFRVLNLEMNSIHMLPFSILLLKDKNVKILLKGNSITPQPSETNVGLERLKKEFGGNIVI